MKFFIPLITFLLLCACSLPEKHPGGSLQEMSAQTLCFRQASARANDAYLAEIEARNIDCAALLREDPLLPHGSELNRAHRAIR